MRACGASTATAGAAVCTAATRTAATGVAAAGATVVGATPVVRTGDVASRDWDWAGGFAAPGMFLPDTYCASPPACRHGRKAIEYIGRAAYGGLGAEVDV